MDAPTYRARDLFSLPGCMSLSRVVMAAWFPFVVDAPWLALGTVALAALSDALDGYLARKQGISTSTGAALDPLTDKIFATSVMVSLLASQRLTLGAAALLSVREVLELPLMIWLLLMPRARVARAAHLKANWLGKLTTGLQFGALVSLLLDLPYTAAWMVATAVTGALAGVMYWLGFLQVLSRGPGSALPGGPHPRQSSATR